MFFTALFDWLLVLAFGTFLVICIWVSAYRYLGFLMPNWLAGIFAGGIIWVRRQDIGSSVIRAMIASTLVDIMIWNSLWLWTALIGLTAVVATWIFSKNS